MSFGKRGGSKQAKRAKSPVIFFDDTAPQMAANGYLPVPIQPGEKRPAAKLMRWQHYRYKKAERRWPGCGVGILTGEVIAVDIDVRDPELARRLRDLAVKLLGAAPERVGAAPKTALIYRVKGEQFRKIHTGDYRLPRDKPGSKAHKVEILAEGEQLVCYHIHPDTGKPYQWNGAGEPLSTPVATLPRVTRQQCEEYLAECEELLTKAGTPCGTLSRGGAKDTDARDAQEALRADNPALVRNALACIPNDDVSYKDWIDMCFAIKGAFGNAGCGDWMRWSALSSKHLDKKSKAAWQSAHPNRRGAASIVHIAKQYGFKVSERAKAPGAPYYGLAESGQTMDKLMAENLAPTKWRVKGLLAQGASVLVVGAPKFGLKSTISIFLGMAMAGIRDLGWEAFPLPAGAPPVNVGYVDLEMTAQKFKETYERFLPERYNKDCAKNFKRYGTEQLGRKGMTKFVLDAQRLAELEAAIVADKLKVMILDNISRCRTDGRGLSAQAADAAAITPLHELAHRTGCLIIILAHANKRLDLDNPMNMVAGTNQMFACVDDGILTFKPPGADTWARHMFVYGRNASTSCGTYLIRSDWDCVVLRGEVGELLAAKEQRAILALLSAGEFKAGATPRQLAKALGKKEDAIRKLLRKLDKRALIGMHNGRWMLPAAVMREVSR